MVRLYDFINKRSIIEDKENRYFDNNYHPYTLSNIDRIIELRNVDKKIIEEIKIASLILPFKTNNYVIKNLINWDKVPNDPIFRLTFPQKKMLLPHHYERIKKAVETEDKDKIKQTITSIQMELNPNPAGQKTYNVPVYKNKILKGVQHKYRETALLFPRSGQTCHAYCTFCFRWSQFTHIGKNHKFGTKTVENFVNYIWDNPTITDILVTGGDPMTMRASVLEKYLKPIYEANIPHLKTIRIGSKSLTYHPMRFINDKDSSTVLDLFQDIIDNNLNLAFMAHFNHYQELQSSYLEIAVRNLKEIGVQIMTQSPLLNHINASPAIWTKMWNMQKNLGMIPYYMFIARDTGAQHYFSVPLVKAWEIFTKAYSRVSGLSRTVRGPSMSCTPGKISIIGVTKIKNQKVMILNFIQGRNPNWVNKPFFAKYNSKAIWLDDLEPAFTNNFFYEKELKKYLGPYNEIKHNIKD